MGDTKNLADQEAIEKIKEMATDKMCLFCTYENGEIVSRPMGTQGIDEDATIWFFSRGDSKKNQQINAEDKVYLMYMDTGSSTYLSLSGHAEIVNDRQKIDELWTKLAKVWFPEGKDDPLLSLIKVIPQDGHYWDTKDGKLVSLLKIAYSAVTGNTMDGGIDGNLKVQL